jgi:hypothetical protein
MTTNSFIIIITNLERGDLPERGELIGDNACVEKLFRTTKTIIDKDRCLQCVSATLANQTILVTTINNNNIKFHVMHAK